MSRFITFLSAFAVCLSLTSCGKKKTDAMVDTYIDATVASPDNYKLLSEEAKIRVVEMKLAAGKSDVKHSHKTETVYFLSGGKFNIHVGDKVNEAQIPDGHVMHHGPWTHRVENIGEKEAHAVIFEQMEATPIPAMENYIDATTAAKDYYRLLSSENNVRVIEMTLPPGKKDEQHSHYAETVYFIKGGKAKIHADGKIMDADIPDGHVMHHDAWTHSVQNVGTSEIKAIIFERMPQ